jgi:hypothetical protein
MNMISVQLSNTKFHENPFSGNTHTHGRANMKCLQYFVKKATHNSTVLSSETSVNISRAISHCKPQDSTHHINTF